MKTLLILPPQWTPFAPPLSLPVLTGYLKHHGCEVSQTDLNIDFYNHILSKDFIINAKNIVDSFMQQDESQLLEDDLKRYHVTLNTLKDLEPWWPNLENNTVRAMQIIKNPESFYQPLFLAEAMFHLRYALLACGLAYFPSDILLNYYANHNYKLNLDSIKLATEDLSGNIFIEFFKNGILQKIKTEKPDLIGISINCNTQMLPGLTLCRMIKSQFPDIHINIGGNAFTRLLDIIKNKPGLFEDFTDTLIYGEGETALLNLIKTVQNNESYFNVNGLAYKKDDEVIINEPSESINLNELAPPDFSGLDITKYLSPEVILPVQSSRGCYWKKCTFCDHDYGNKYAIKTPSKMAEELKELTIKYNAKHFYFVDESISPNYMKNLAEKIIELGLEISWYTCARAEEGFTPEICALAAKSGLKMVLWGLESGSERILNLINKGISRETYITTLTNTHNAEIWNHAFVFYGFPSETMLEAMETVNLLLENKGIINSYGMGPFTLGKYSPVAKEPEAYFISDVAPYDQEFCTATENFNTTQGMTRDEVGFFILTNTEYCAQEYGYPLWLSLGGYKDHIFLYLAKYGSKVLSYTPDETVQMFGSF